MHIMPYLQCFVFNVPNLAPSFNESFCSIYCSVWNQVVTGSVLCEAIPLFSFSPVCNELFFSVWIGNVLCIVCFPDELARVASVLCAEVCVKCFVCRELYNNCNLFYSFDSQQTAEVCRKSILLCFVLTCKQRSAL